MVSSHHLSTAALGWNTAATQRFMTVLRVDEWDHSNREYNLLQDTRAEMSLQTAASQAPGRQEHDVD